MAGTKNWDWKRGQLRSRVRVEAWQQSMRTALEALGLTVDVSASTWTTPGGLPVLQHVERRARRVQAMVWAVAREEPVRTADNPVQRLHRIVLPAIVA